MEQVSPYEYSGFVLFLFTLVYALILAVGAWVCDRPRPATSRLSARRRHKLLRRRALNNCYHSGR